MATVPSMTVPVELDLSGGCIVRPGDTLIILSKGNLSAEMADTFKDRALELLPGLADVVVIGADGLAVYRPDPVSDVEHAG